MRICSLVSVAFFGIMSSLAVAQNIPDLTSMETGKYLFTLSGEEIGNANFSDSVFTKIGGAIIHIRESNDYSEYWYTKYGRDFAVKNYGADKADASVFDIIRPFSFDGYREAQIRYSQFIDKRIKGIPQYAKYKTNVEQLLSKVSNAGGIGKLFLLSSYNSPVYFTSFNKKLTPFLYVGSTTLMNIRRGQEERMAHILKEEVIPVLSCFYGTFDDTIQYYGLSYSYVSGLLSGDDFNALGETISVIAPAKSVADYKNLVITQDELLKACELYYVNSRNKEVRKISYDSLK